MHEKKENWWILDRGCSRHTSGKASLYYDLKKQSVATITLGDKSKCDIKGVRMISNDSLNSIDDVYLGSSLKYDLLSIS